VVDVPFEFRHGDFAVLAGHDALLVSMIAPPWCRSGGRFLHKRLTLRAWLSNQDFSASQLIAAMETAVSGGPSYGYGVLNSSTTAAFVGTNNTDGTPIAGLPANASITVNSNGAFFNSAYTVGSGFVQYTGGTLQAQIFILVHELAHEVGAAGFQPDAGNPSAGASNNALVQKNCGSQIAGVH